MNLNSSLWSLLAVGAAVLVVGSTTAHAKTAQFGMAGCGVSSLIFDKPEDYEEKWKQIAGSLVESYLGIQSSAITSGTSNCRYTDSKTVDARDVFIDVNSPIIAQDAARGGGESINTLATMTGCSDASILGNTLQKNYSKLFGRELSKDEKMSTRLRSFMKSDETLAQSCSKQG